MSSRSSRHLVRANSSTCLSAPSPPVLPGLAAIRRAHSSSLASPSSPHPHSNRKLPRRNAHALASQSRYIERAPPPPPPSPSVTPADRGATPGRETFRASRDTARKADVDAEAFPTWESREPPSNETKGFVERGYVELGETVYADGVEGEVELDWDDWRQVTQAPVKKVSGATQVIEKGTQVSEAVEPKPLTVQTSSKRKGKETVPEPGHLFTARVRRDPAAHLRLRPSQRIPANTISPYVAPDPPTFRCQVHPSPQPHEFPLVSRSDWRLSSPLRRYLRSNPASLYSRLENDTKAQGHNFLVGVGIETSRITKSFRSPEVAGSEPWGWKVKVKEAERGGWPAADLYRKRLDRLISLSRQADEENYRLSLARQGTPSERELDGKTLCRAIGTWLTDSSRAEELQELKKQGSGSSQTSIGTNGSGPRAIASFRAEDERELTEDLWNFSAANTIVRITRSPAEDDLDPDGPQAPPSAALDSDAWFVQGTVLEARGSQLVVAFEEFDMWPLSEDETYQIDIGLDESSYALQEQAINNLYFDPARQRTRNGSHVQSAQQALSDGLTTLLREWTLQGTDLRELIVPRMDKGVGDPVMPIRDVDEDLLDDSPTAELARLPLPESLLTPDLTLKPQTGSSTALHPSDLITQNQLINSWVQRHMRDDPMELPGDPDLGLNPSQTKAVAMAIGEKLSLIQGPPGTGKSQTIVSLIALLKLHFRIPQPILLAAPTHVSTDHLLSLLVRRGLNPLRCGKPSKVSPDIEKWTIEKRQEQHPLWNRLEETRLQSESLRDEVKRNKELTALIANPRERKAAEARDLELEQRYRKSWRKYIMLEQRLYSSLLATADVFCATALGSGASKVLNLVDFPIVFIDEAAMCTEPVTLIPLMKGAQQATLIGDHKQLPAVVSSQDAKKERLQISLFERLLTSSNVNSVLLDTQYRMRPAISAFPNLSFYRSALQDANSVKTRPLPPRSRFFTSEPPDATAGTSSESLPVAFVSHSGPEAVNRRSTLNRTEVDLIVEIVGDLLDRNPALDPRDIGIISPYFAQTQLLVNTFESGWAAKRLSKLLGRSRASELQSIEINTVDGFQGREKKIIILSTVRSNRAGRIGFLTDKRRLNVALTRAKDALFVVGNKDTLRLAAANDWIESDPDSDAGIWRRFLAWCEQRGLVREWKHGRDVEAGHV
ncbi:hypothetical protein JCM11491_006473 [Sporobolomyces phaffii]